MGTSTGTGSPRVAFEDDGTLLRQKLRTLYEEHEPGKLPHIEKIVRSRRYKGRAELLNALEDKYGKETVAQCFAKVEAEKEEQEAAERREVVRACMAVEEHHQASRGGGGGQSSGRSGR